MARPQVRDTHIASLFQRPSNALCHHIIDRLKVISKSAVRTTPEGPIIVAALSTFTCPHIIFSLSLVSITRQPYFQFLMSSYNIPPKGQFQVICQNGTGNANYCSCTLDLYFPSYNVSLSRLSFARHQILLPRL